MPAHNDGSIDGCPCAPFFAQIPRCFFGAQLPGAMCQRPVVCADSCCVYSETMGVCSDASTKAFRSVEVDGFLARTPKDIFMQKGSYFYHHQTKFVVIAVDPSGGGNSAFGIAAFHYT